MTAAADGDALGAVGATALGAAAVRAVESGRRDPLVRDPYAAAFVRAAAAASLPAALPTTPEEADRDPSSLVSVFGPHFAVKSRCFDDFMVSAAAAGVRQVVLLAAGLDTRAYRLPWPQGTVLFELDAARVLRFKDRVLTSAGAHAGCARRAVPADLRTEWTAALEAAGFDAARPAAWLVEGLLPYLDDGETAALLRAVDRLSAPGSRMAVEHLDAPHTSLREDAALRGATAERGFELAGIVPEGRRLDPAGLLSHLGWSVTETTTEQLAAEYHRALPATLPDALRQARLILATR